MTYQHLTLRMLESAKKNEGMVDQKIFKTAKKYGFDSVYLDECSIDMLEKYVTYIRPFLMPTCEYVLVNRNGKQFQNLTDLFSVLVFEAIGNTFIPLDIDKLLKRKVPSFSYQRNRNGYLKTKSIALTLARVHYQKKRSREVAMRGRRCMEKLVVESNNMDEQYEKIQHSSAAQDDVRQDTSIVCRPQITPRRKGIRFTGGQLY